MPSWLTVRLVRRVVLVTGAVLLAYYLVTFFQVWRAARSDDERRSQAIIVLGAAQYNGRPSADFRSRLDHAADLFHRRVAPLVVVTGGKQPGDRFTESAAGADYLHGRGVPKSELPRKHEVEAHYDNLGACMQEIENRGNYFGAFASTVILISKSLDRVRATVSQVVKVFGRWDASLIDERLNLFASWLSILPGNYRYTRRYQYLLNVNYADMALIWASYTGEKRNPHLKDEYLCTFETPDQQLFYFNGHVGGVCGMQILGAPESGKSFLTNYLSAQWQKYDPATMILDIGHSYRDLVPEFGGSYFEISLKDQTARINPFSLPPTADNLEFLFYFVRLLVGHDPEAALDDQATRRGVRLHIHLLETIYQRAYAVRQYGQTAVARLEALGLLHPGVTFVHCVWATAEDCVKIPVSVVYRKGVKEADGSNPLYTSG